MKGKLFILFLMLISAVAFFVYKEWNRTHADLSETKAAQHISAISLIAAFEKDTAAASKQYTDKILAVSGILKKIDGEKNSIVFFLGNPDEMSSVQCNIDSVHANKYGGLKEGMQITVKGMCNGYQSDELLGTDVKVNRCVIELKQ